jgi:hypothetical protein
MDGVGRCALGESFVAWNAHCGGAAAAVLQQQKGKCWVDGHKTREKEGLALAEGQAIRGSVSASRWAATKEDK